MGMMRLMRRIGTKITAMVSVDSPQCSIRKLWKKWLSSYSRNTFDFVAVGAAVGVVVVVVVAVLLGIRLLQSWMMMILVSYDQSWW